MVFSAGGERRHLTVLFCDVVGSTEMAAQLDPEEWHEFVAGYHRAAAEAITRYSGHVAIPRRRRYGLFRLARSPRK
jgi:class 3 adenylate cyclase